MPTDGSFSITIIYLTYSSPSLTQLGEWWEWCIQLFTKASTPHLQGQCFGFTSVNGITNKATCSQQIVKRTVDVNETVSTVVALVYLVVWLAGVMAVCVFCCRSRPRGHTLYLNLPWRRERAKGKQPEESDIGLMVWSFFCECDLSSHLPQGMSRISQRGPSVAPREGLHLEQKQYPFSYSWTARNMIEPDGRDELGMDDRVSGAPGGLGFSSEDSTYTRGEPTRGNREADLDSDVLAAEFTHVTVPTASSSKQHDVLSPAPRVHFFRVQNLPQNAWEKWVYISGCIYQRRQPGARSPCSDDTDISSHYLFHSPPISCIFFNSWLVSSKLLVWIHGHRCL